MFGFLKDKLKKGIATFGKKVEEEGEEDVVEEVAEEKPVEAKEESPAPEEKEETVIEEKSEESSEDGEGPQKKEGFFKKLFKKKEEEYDEILDKDEVEEEKIDSEEVEPEEKAPVETTEETPVKEIEEKPQEEEKSNQEAVEKRPEPVVEQEAKEVIEKEPPQKIEEEPKKVEDVQEQTSQEKSEPVEEKPIEEQKEAPKEEVVEDEEPDKEVPQESAKEEKKGFFGKIKEKIVTKKINTEKFEEMFWDLELALLENNVAMEVVEKIKEDLKNDMVDTPIKRGKIEETILLSLKKSIEEVLDSHSINMMQRIEEKKPYVICFLGINGSGKTTSIAKVAKMFQDKGKTVVLAAADTFRAAAIDQLQIHANNLGIKMIKHDYGSDPSAVAFDAIKYAKAKEIDVVLIDTAGRLHSNSNLVDEMKKIVRVAEPDLKLFVGESITGNDCVEQASKFNEAVTIDGIILSKADIDEKGGASLSISYVTKKPVLYLGVGQEYTDIKPFNKNEIINSLGLEA